MGDLLNKIFGISAAIVCLIAMAGCDAAETHTFNTKSQAQTSYSRCERHQVKITGNVGQRMQRIQAICQQAEVMGR